MRLGFTLMEIMIAVAVIAVLATGGMLVIARTLGSRGQSQGEININQAGAQAMAAFERSVRYGVVTQVGTGDRNDCIAASAAGVSGNDLIVKDAWGMTTYSLITDRIASVAGSTKYLTTPDVDVSSLEFTWYCAAGAPDKLRISFDMDDPVIQGGILLRNFERDISLYNSGI